MVGLTRVELEHFTAFSKLTLDLSPGINVLVGANGTGKTHLMKVCYAACDAYKNGRNRFADKLVGVFLPSGGSIGRLVHRQRGRSEAVIKVFRGQSRLRSSFSSQSASASSAKSTRSRVWIDDPVSSVYIPVKEMLANAPGFRSLYETRAIHFEEVYKDILDHASIPALREQTEPNYRRLLKTIQNTIKGKVVVNNNEEYFLRNKQGSIEFSLLAEGIRKLALLWLLIRNGTLRPGSVLLWDEPETNLNPKLFRTVIDVLLKLQRNGVQIMLATHDYVILKEFDLHMVEDDKVAFHSLYRDSESGEIACRTTDEYLDIEPNAIGETFDDLYDREIARGMRVGFDDAD